MRVKRIVGIGELLWDMLPTGPQLGGAPANFSVMAARLGNQTTILSRIGTDALAGQTLEVLAGYPVDASHLQQDTAHPTGQVSVELADGQPSYVIHAPAAWDFLEASDAWTQVVRQCDAICFGSLAQRSAVSAAAIVRLLRSVEPQSARIFDVNLREPYYSSAVLQQSLTLASVVKMNDAEVPRVLELLQLPAAGSDPFRAAAEALLEQYPALELVAITCGGGGSLLVSRQDWHRHPGIPTEVMDTIGAGDAFTAAMTHYLLRQAPLAVLNEAGNRWGSYLASQAGAMPPIPEQTMDQIRREIEG